MLQARQMRKNDDDIMVNTHLMIILQKISRKLIMGHIGEKKAKNSTKVLSFFKLFLLFFVSSLLLVR
jgi:hypothetical protein